MTNYDIYNLVNFILNKEQTGNTVSPIEIDRLLKLGNIDAFNYCFGIQESLKRSQGVQPAYGDSQQSIDELSVFLVKMGWNTSPLLINSDGIANKPSDYFHFSSMMQKVSDGDEVIYSDIEIITDNQLPNRLGNSLKMPTLENPIVVEENTYFQFFPKNIKQCYFHYLRKPKDPVFSVEYNEDGTFTYLGADEETNPSVELEWNDTGKIRVMRYLLTYIGINLKDQAIMQYAESHKEKGV